MAYLYRHIRADLNQPFYIGIGSDNNYTRAQQKTKRNNFWNNIVSKTDYKVEIMLDNLTWEEACEKEKEFIALYGRKDNNTGILVNMTDGGEGTLNIIISQDLRRKISDRMSGIKNPNYGKKRSIEVKEKISKSKIGIKLDEVIKLKIKNTINSFTDDKKRDISLKLSKVNKGRVLSQDHKNKISNSQKGAKHHSAIKIKDTFTNKIYDTVIDASKDLNISKSNIYYWITKQQRFIKL